ncbi:DsbA family protein [Cupriavidus basilensis]|uniref:DsbA family protein n=1 Tax=Cupriavidus basilensis TaxID=68895 RepID=A0A643FL60_9BURK|nr:DsbA family protein [Cupriavidus basilensis]
MCRALRNCCVNRSELPGPVSALTSSPTLRVDFYLDLICPWCWIGLRSLRLAWESLRQKHPGLVLETIWHAHALLPQIPAQGIPYQAFYEARLGGQRAVAMRRAQIRAVAESVDLSLNFENIATFPNSALACALVNAAQSKLAPVAMYQLVESIYRAFFSQGQDIGSTETLQALAQASGFSWDGSASSQLQPSMEADHGTGVPHLVFNGQWPVTGAVPGSELVHVMQQAVAAKLG